MVEGIQVTQDALALQDAQDAQDGQDAEDAEEYPEHPGTSPGIDPYPNSVQLTRDDTTNLWH